MTVDAWLSVAVVALVFAALAWGRWPPYLVLLGGLGVVLVGGLVPPAQALAGFANEGMITVAVLFVVAAGLRQTGVLAALVRRLLGRPRTAGRARLRLCLPTAAGSAFLNNTPLVAMLLPVVIEWGRAARLPASKLLLPLSYAAILGGLCTLIGTSTNLVVNGLLIAEGRPGFGLFDLAWVGLPCAAVGMAFLLIAARWLLPERAAAAVAPADPREYTVEMVVAPGGPLAGRAIEAAGLRHLPGLYLAELHRGAHVLPAVDPAERLDAGDQLVFVGAVDSVVDLQRIPGLAPATRQVFRLDSARSERCFAEAVVSPVCPLVGRTIREGRFRTRYNAVVLAVSREGARAAGRLGDVTLHAGDALLLEALPSFIEQQRRARDFYLVSRLAGAGPLDTRRAPVAASILAGMVLAAALGVFSMLQAAMLAAAAMLLTRCCREDEARQSVDWPLLLAIGASFGLGHALHATGAAGTLAGLLVGQAGSDPWLALVLFYVAASVVTEFVTNNAAAVIMFPIAMATAGQLGAHHEPFVIGLMIAASASFATPLGYQTNLMVYGPGGYRLRDFLKMGLPMNVLVGTVACLLAPRLWPFGS